MNKKYYLLILALLFFFISCAPTVQTNELLQSKWMINKAMRNGRVTSTLEKGFFKFWNHDSLETNILGQIVKTKYKLNKNIIVSESELPSISVVDIGKDTLVLETKINKYLFSFILTKNNK